MKKLLIIILLLLLCSCGIMKNKLKEKQESESSVKTEMEASSQQTNEEMENNSFLDSVAQKTHFNAAKSLFSNSQNFNLTNNGKCGDPGVIRFVQITDAKGNTTSIPVTDNTDLNFVNESKYEAEILDLKTEISSLIKENDSIKKSNELLHTSNINQSTELSNKSLDLDLQTKSSPLSAFIWVAILSVIVWELLKHYLKKLI